MLTVAAQLDLVAGLLAVIAAIFPVGPVGRHDTVTHGMRAFGSGIGHDSSLLRDSTPIARSGARRLLGLALIAGLSATPAAAQTVPPTDLADTLARVSQRVEGWYARTQSVVSMETVWIQPLRADLTPVGFARRLVFELRVGWDPGLAGPGGVPAANVLRQPVDANGRSVRESEESRCLDPKPVSPEPLAMLLPARLGESEFAVAGVRRIDGRQALVIDYHGRTGVPPDIRWTSACVSVDLPGRSRGRIWVDAATYEVLRMDDRLVGTFEFDVPREHARRGVVRSMVIERAESSVQYKPVAFQDPQETLMLPVSIESLSVIRGGGMQRVRITQRFSGHRRFLTAGRLVN